MYSIKNVLPCMSVLKNTTSIELSAKEVNDADEDIVKPVGKGFVRQFHHFKYAGPGVVLCQYIKGKGVSVRKEMSQSKGMHRTDVPLMLMMKVCVVCRAIAANVATPARTLIT